MTELAEHIAKTISKPVAPRINPRLVDSSNLPTEGNGPDLQRAKRRPSATSCAAGWRTTSPSPSRADAGDDAQFAWRRDWQRRLYDAGWAAPAWPTEYGGRGASPSESAIYFEEIGRARVPFAANTLGLLLGGPTLMVWGTPEQKERYLPPILSARGDLVPGLLRARRRLGPRGAENARGQGRR